MDGLERHNRHMWPLGAREAAPYRHKKFLAAAQIPRNRLELRKIRGEVNPDDLFTKHLSSQECIHRFLELFDCHYASSRAELAPKLRQDVGTSKGEGLCSLAADGDELSGRAGRF